MKLHADLSKRACQDSQAIDWVSSPSAGVDRCMLERDDEHEPVERATTIVRFAPGSSFSGHVHGGGEEFLVLEGVFSDQTGDFPRGSYVRNPPGTGHAPSSEPGCTILVKLWQMAPDDTQQVNLNTLDQNNWQDGEQAGEQIMPLFHADYEQVDMLRWQKGLVFDPQTFVGGVEYYVLSGCFRDEQGSYASGTWLRLPAASQQTIEVMEECVVYRKTGHLLHPVKYI